MPIYEFACPQCRVIFNFFSKRINPPKPPVCPKCGNKKMAKQVSNFALTRGVKESAAPTVGDPEAGDDAMPNLDDPRVQRAMNEMERDMEHLDENNPKHMAHMMRKMKEMMPPGAMPKEMDIAIKRLEAGEDPEKSRRTWAMCWGTSWAKKVAIPVRAEIIPTTPGSMIIEVKKPQ